MIQQHVVEVNKTALETEKERDELHNQIEQIEEQLHPKKEIMMMLVMLMKCSQKLIIGT